MKSDSLEKSSEAANFLDLAVARDPQFALAYCLLVEAHLNRYWVTRHVPDAVGKAEIALQAARRLAPEAGETHLAEAMFSYRAQRDYHRALEGLEKAARSLPNSADVLRLSGFIERRLGRWKESVRHTLRAAELDPADWIGRDSLISTYEVTRHHVEARQLADRMVTEFPEKSHYFRMRKAWASLAAGNLPQARIDSAGLRLDSDTKALLWLVPFWERDYSEAYRILALAERFDHPGDRYPTSFQKGLTARAAGDFEKAHSAFLPARKFYLGVLTDAPENKNVNDATEVTEMQPVQAAYYPEMLSQLAIVDAGLGRKDEALREARRAIELRPISRDAAEGPQVAANLAIVYLLLGEREHALEQLSSLVKVPNGFAYGDLKLDPIWDELRDDPRFAQSMAVAAEPIPLQ